VDETIRVQLGFPLEQVKKPIIWQLAHDFGLRFSVRKADIDIKAGGYTVLDLTGPREKIDEALVWAKSEGVEVSTIGATGADEWLLR
jgi:ABC-type methionine transport system ATPase subunit